jgi:hypothetical protein
MGFHGFAVKGKGGTWHFRRRKAEATEKAE